MAKPVSWMPLHVQFAHSPVQVDAPCSWVQETHSGPNYMCVYIYIFIDRERDIYIYILWLYKLYMFFSGGVTPWTHEFSVPVNRKGTVSSRRSPGVLSARQCETTKTANSWGSQYVTTKQKRISTGLGSILKLVLQQWPEILRSWVGAQGTGCLCPYNCNRVALWVQPATRDSTKTE